MIPILVISILIHEYQVLFLGIHLLFTILKLDEREKRDWDLAYEKYNRNQQMVENSAKQDIEDRQRANDFRDKNEVALTKMKLDAAKDIAKSLAKKKPNTTNLIFRK